MFFPDRVRGYKEVYRVLAGRLFSHRISANVFADVVTEALTILFPPKPTALLGPYAASTR